MHTRLTVGLIGVLLLVSTPASSTTMVMMNDEALTMSSDAIVSGTVVDIRSARTTDGIRTFVTIAVDEMLKGSIGTATITLRETGGSVGDEVQWLFGNPTYEVGESAIVFVARNGDGTLRTNQMSLGKFSIERDADTDEEIAVRTIDDTVLMLGTQLLQSHDPESRRSAAGFKARLRDIVRTQPAPTFQQPLDDPGAPDVLIPDGATVAEYALFNNKRWFEPDDGQPVKYYVDSRGDADIGASDSRAAILAAFAAWTNVPTASIVLQYAGPTSATSSVCDGVNKILFNDPAGSITNPNSCGGILAVGGYCGGGGSKTVNGVNFGRIVEADVTFNNGWGNCGFWNETNLAEIATHEVGHTIGIGHSGDSSATMYAYAHFDGRGASLMPDDVAAVSFIYPETNDRDADRVPDTVDNCPGVANPGQDDVDADGFGDACDNCVARPNPNQSAADACGLLQLNHLNLRIDAHMNRNLVVMRGKFTARTANLLSAAIGGNAVVIKINAPNGDTIVQQTVPGGYWLSNRRGTRVTYRDRKRERGALQSVWLYSHKGSKYLFSASAAGLALSGGTQPALEVELQIGGDTYVSATRCSVNARATRVRCKQKKG